MYLDAKARRLRIAVIGLDGMSWSILLRYLEVIPNIRKLIHRSFTGTLRCVPPLTPPSWTTIFTGVKMNKHGVYGFTKYIEYQDKVRPTFFTSEDVRIPRLSEILALISDYQSLVVGLPFSYPARGWYLKKHVLVYDAFAPRPFIYPHDYNNYLRFFKYVGYRDVRPSDLAEKIIDDMIRYVEMRIRGVELLLSEIDPNLLIVVFQETDSAMHVKPNIPGKKYDRKYASLLALIDRFIGDIIKKFDVVLIVSDHGIELYRKSINMAYVMNLLGSICDSTLRERLTSIIMTNYLIGSFFYLMLKQEISYKIFYYLRKTAMNLTLKNTLQNNVNSVGSREGKALLDLGDADDSWLIYLRDRRMVKHSLRVIKEVFGKYLETMEVVRVSDNIYAVLVIPKEGFYLNFGTIHNMNSKNVLWYPSTRHSPYGIFLLWRKGIEIGKYIGIIKNYDVLPSVLALLGAPLPSYGDGNAIEPMQSSLDERKRLDYRPIWKLAKKMYWLRKSIS